MLPKRIDHWSLTSVQQRLVKTGGRLVKHARYYWLLLADATQTGYVDFSLTAGGGGCMRSGQGQFNTGNSGLDVMKRAAAPSILVLFFIYLLFSIPQTSSSGSTRGGDLTQLKPYVDFLTEFSHRRRANIYFRNEQSIFDGVQVNFVNVGRGNLTFLRRDLVSVGRIPLVLARVYDSAAPASAEFGPGWRFSAAESIEVRDRVARLLTETGSEIHFLNSGDAFVPARDFPSDYLELTRTPQGTLVAKLRNGFAKEYTLIGKAYRLTRVVGRNGNNVKLFYRGDRLSRVENGSHFIELTRNDIGRIVLARDDQGRSVAYSYTNHGALMAVTDIGGNVWNYKYTSQAQLHKALDPMGRENFKVWYTADGRVQSLELPSGRIAYDYGDSSHITTITDRKNLVSRFFQNEEGITTRIVNALGEETSITLDEARNPREIGRNGILTQRMEYDQHHRITLRESFEPRGRITARYKYAEATGQLAAIEYSDGKIREFGYDGRGNLVTASDPDAVPHLYEYSAQGDLTSARKAGAASLTLAYHPQGLISRFLEGAALETSLQYTGDGKLSEVSLADGFITRMEHGRLGLRWKLARSDRSAVDSTYDPAGNLIEIQLSNSDGTRIGQRLVLDDSYGIVKQIFDDGQEVDSQYDNNGNLMEAKLGLSVTRFEYDAVNRLTAVITPQGQRLVYSYAPGEPSLVAQADLHTGLTASERRDTGLTFAPQWEVTAARSEASQFGSVRFSESLTQYQLSAEDGKEIVTGESTVEGPLHRLRLLSDGVPPMQRQVDFQRLSNLFFLPPEYASINCLPPCPDCIPGPPPASVILSGPDNVPLLGPGAVGPNSITLTAGGSPGGGIFYWNVTQTGSGKVRLLNLDNSAEITSDAASGSLGDVTISVSYYVNGQCASDSKSITVQKPTALVIVPGTSSTTAEGPCTVSTPSGPVPGCGVTRTFKYEVQDQFSPPRPIQVSGMQFWDSITAGTPNTCNMNTFDTTCTFAGKTNSGPCDQITDGLGRFSEKLFICSAVCRSPDGTCTTGCTTFAPQKWTINGFEVPVVLRYQCDNILANGL